MNESQTSKSPWGGWLLHAVIGAGVTAVLAWLGAPPVAVLAAVLAMGIAHEIGDGDFLQANGGPWDGGVDLLAVLPAAVVLAVVPLLRRGWPRPGVEPPAPGLKARSSPTYPTPSA